MTRLFVIFILSSFAWAISAQTFSQTTQSEELQEANRLLKQGQHQQALDKVNTHLSSKPKDASGRFLKGLILTEQNKNTEAIKVFTALTEDYPALPEPYNNLAVLYAAQGQFDKARNALEMAIQTHPSYATAHENLGDIYAKMATIAYDKALQLDKGNVAAQTKLSMVKELFSAPQTNSKPTTNPIAQVTPAVKPIAEAKPNPVVATPAEKPTPAAKPTDNPEKDAILLALNNWAKAWSEQNVPAYLDFYDASFKPVGESRANWEKSRRERIKKPKSIRVAIVAPSIAFADATHAKVHFKQLYHSEKIKSSTEKTIYLVKSGSDWLITQEKIGRN